MRKPPKILFYVVTGSDLKKLFMLEAVCNPLIFTGLQDLYANELMAMLGSRVCSSFMNRTSNAMKKIRFRSTSSTSLRDFLQQKTVGA